ncbi:MAG: hypothetical protein ACYC3N_10695, partial [Halothiobacillus sp.]
MLDMPISLGFFGAPRYFRGAARYVGFVKEPLINSLVSRGLAPASRFAYPKGAKRGRGRRSYLLYDAKADNKVLRLLGGNPSGRG